MYLSVNVINLSSKVQFAFYDVLRTWKYSVFWVISQCWHLEVNVSDGFFPSTFKVEEQAKNMSLNELQGAIP
jgi:hypothetical protein